MPHVDWTSTRFVFLIFQSDFNRSLYDLLFVKKSTIRHCTVFFFQNKCFFVSCALNFSVFLLPRMNSPISRRLYKSYVVMESCQTMESCPMMV